MQRLPGKTRHLYGGFFPTFTDTGEPLVSPFLRRLHSLLRRVFPQHDNLVPRLALRKYFNRERIAAVLAEYGPTAVSVMDVCHTARIPLIAHFHGFDAYDARILETYGQRYRRMFEIAAAIVAVSHDMERQLLELGAVRDKLFYNPYGVDTDTFSGADPASAIPVFLAVGRFVDKKAPHLTLIAFSKAHKLCSDARLSMIGDGPLLEACRQLAGALELSDCVQFLGARPHSEVAAQMRSARAFVQHSLRTSYGDSEGTPVAVLEACATGLPVIATRHAGIRDVVVEGETGFLVDERDVNAMADRMVQLAQNPALAGRMGASGRKRIETHFAMQKSLEGLWSIIQRCISS